MTYGNVRESLLFSFSIGNVNPIYRDPLIHSRETGLGRTCHRDHFLGATIAKTLPGISLAVCKARRDNDSKQGLETKHVHFAGESFALELKGATQARRA